MYKFIWKFHRFRREGILIEYTSLPNETSLKSLHNKIMQIHTITIKWRQGSFCHKQNTMNKTMKNIVDKRIDEFRIITLFSTVHEVANDQGDHAPRLHI